MLKCHAVMEPNYDDIYEFLTFHRYPTGFSKNQKRVLRRKSQEYFRVKWGLLFYSKVPKSRAVGCKGRVDREWRKVPRTVQEQERIVRACHSSVEGRQESLIKFYTASLQNYVSFLCL